MALPGRAAADAGDIEAELARIFDAVPGPATRLADAMRYATMNGGKRLRGCLVLASSRLAAGPGARMPAGIYRLAAAVECLHAYSLIHDDLPAMDDTDTRRGNPACHVAFDEATAILAGDALQTLAFELLADPKTHKQAEVRAQLVGGLAAASGAAGMAGGQMLDLEGESRTMSLDETREMQGMKTGALIEFAALAGAIHAGADDSLRTALRAFSRDLGLAFQIADDLLDHEGDDSELGKPAGRDAKRGKASLVALMGAGEARAQANSLISSANAAIAGFDGAASLCEIARFAVDRRS